MKVVIFTEDKVGEGHYQAARAVAAALTQLSPEKINVQVVGGMRLVHPFFERSAAKIYLTMIRYWPRGWSYLYNNVRQPFSLQQKLFQVRLIRYLQEEKPDMVLCTHPACTNALAQLKAKVDHPYRLGVIFTDFGFHPFAVSPEADYFFVPDQSVKFTLIHQYQINPNRIFALRHSRTSPFPSIDPGKEFRTEERKRQWSASPSCAWRCFRSGSA